MARGTLKFKQRDVTRAVRGVAAAGIEVERVEVDKDGKIIVVVGSPAEAAIEHNELDRWKADRAL